jgi:hypothetical protein
MQASFGGTSTKSKSLSDEAVATLLISGCALRG